jgi:RNA recognition motif-containing protein
MAEKNCQINNKSMIEGIPQNILRPFVSKENFVKEKESFPTPNPLQELNNNEDPENDLLLKLFVGGLNYLSLQSDIKSYFETFGKVLNCSLLIDKASSKSRGFAFVTIEDPCKESSLF